MLTFMIKTTESLVFASILLGLVYVFLNRDNKTKRIGMIFTALGLAASVVMSYMKNATSKVDTSIWNLRIFALSLIVLIVFYVTSCSPLIKKAEEKMRLISSVALSVVLFTIYLYALPDVWAYPHNFLGTEQSAMSTDFLFRLIGMAVAIIICMLTAFAVYQSAKRVPAAYGMAVIKGALLVNALRQISVALSIMNAKRMIVGNHTLFLIAKYTSNYANVFVYVGMVIGLIPALWLFVKSFKVNEPYENPAQKRKIRAKWIVTRRWSVTLATVLILSVINMTAVKAYDNREVELSPVEDAAVEGDSVKVPFEMVEDGHLHRFAYVTDDGVQIRFIIIKKPNSSSYGIGLDACDICGETGYFEKDGQVVCKLCDVVMNISTIGFKGGCNPIVIDYSIHDGCIFVPIEGLLEYKSEFK